MTAGELYDDLQSWFGIGDWVEESGVPWYRARSIEIGKLKRMLKSRHVTEDDVHLAAVYARKNGIAIVATWRLFELIPDARKANRPPAVDELQTAIAEAIRLGEIDWAVRLDSVHRKDHAAVTAALKEYQDR